MRLRLLRSNVEKRQKKQINVFLFIFDSNSVNEFSKVKLTHPHALPP